jgi:Ca-activated chloride channel family protein
MGNEIAIMKTLAGEKMPLLGVTARGILSGELFELEVEQRYRNNDDKNIEAIYTFPLASRAVLLGIEFELNGKKLAGTAVEKEQAERKYEKAIDKGNTAILLEKSGEGLYTINLGNLMAGEEAVVRYRYAEPLVWEQGQLRLVIPTAIAPRYGNPESAGLLPHQIPEVDLGVSYPFTLSIDVFGDLAKGNIASPSHALSVTAIEDGVRLALNKGWLDRDFILTMAATGTSKLSIVQDGEQWIAMATFCPSMPDNDTRLPVTLRLVIDCSGSMAGDCDSSLAEKVSVRAGTLEANHVTVHTVNQDPVGFNMKVAAWLPFAFQRVVTKLARERLVGQ